TNKAAPDEFRLASTQLKRIASALNVSSARTVFIPGNHDVDWKVLDVDPGDRSDFRLRQRYQPFEQAECVFAQSLDRAVPNKLTQASCFCLWQFENCLVLGVNTAFHDGPKEETHHGRIPQESLLSIDQELQLHPVRTDQLRVAVVHHHPTQYSD